MKPLFRISDLERVVRESGQTHFAFGTGIHDGTGCILNSGLKTHGREQVESSFDKFAEGVGWPVPITRLMIKAFDWYCQLRTGKLEGTVDLPTVLLFLFSISPPNPKLHPEEEPYIEEVEAVL